MSFNQQANSQQALVKKLVGVDFNQKLESAKFDAKEINYQADTSTNLVELHNRGEGRTIYGKTIW
jgi:hypothetical protein